MGLIDGAAISLAATGHHNIMAQTCRFDSPAVRVSSFSSCLVFLFVVLRSASSGSTQLPSSLHLDKTNFDSLRLDITNSTSTSSSIMPTKLGGTQWDSAEFLMDLSLSLYVAAQASGGLGQNTRDALVVYLQQQGHKTSWEAIR